MPHFEVTVYRHEIVRRAQYADLYVEAASEEEARAMAQQRLDTGQHSLEWEEWDDLWPEGWEEHEVSYCKPIGPPVPGGITQEMLAEYRRRGPRHSALTKHISAALKSGMPIQSGSYTATLDRRGRPRVECR